MSENVFNKLQTVISIDNLEKAFSCGAKIASQRSNIIGISGIFRSVAGRYHNGLMTEENYSVASAKHRTNLLFFVKQMSRQEQERLLTCIRHDQKISKTILFIESSPKDAASLQTGFEFKEVREAIRLGAFGDQYELQDLLVAATPSDMVNALIAGMPRFVHFSGHAGAGGVLLNNERNEAEVMYTATLAGVLKKISGLYDQEDREIELIFLNACRSETALQAISSFSLYCIGMSDYVADEAAMSFSRQFYSTLANMASPDIEACFRLALLLWSKQHKEGDVMPQIWKKGQKMAPEV